MKVLILYFSTSGNTEKVARLLAESLRNRNADVQMLNITADRDIFEKKDFKTYFRRRVLPHDVICIGFPVYVDHLHYTIKRMIEAFPFPGNGWGKWAVPFVTYGGISSGFALHEAAKKLGKSGRITVSAMKINAFHNFTRRFENKINEGMPGDEAVPHIETLADRIIRLQDPSNGQPLDISKHLNYHTMTSKLKFSLFFREKLFHRFVFPDVEIHRDICVKCGICASQCPILRLELSDTGPVVTKNANSCIHCGECAHHCPSSAARFNVNKFENMMMKASEGSGFLASGESPKSAVYPI